MSIFVALPLHLLEKNAIHQELVAIGSTLPIIFMTGLTETEHLVAALEAGGVDYVTKPIKPKEVLARMGVHMQGARQARQTRNALDAFGYASITVRASDGKLMWQTPLARELLMAYYGTSAPEAPQPVIDWLRRHLDDAEREDRRREPVGMATNEQRTERHHGRQRSAEAVTPRKIQIAGLSVHGLP